MWARYELKESAKNVLRRNYWMPFLTSLIYGLITGFLGGGSSSDAPQLTLHLDLENPNLQCYLDQLIANVGNAEWFSFLALTGMAAVAAAVLGILISYALQFFAIGPLQVGLSRFYLIQRERDADLGELFSGFRKDYLNLAGAQFITFLLISLMNLLIIPGIIFGYKWHQVPYILAENPQLSGKRAREISDAMTMGDKWEMFALDWSFVGWILLGAMACGLGVLFVEPYMHATYAELYARQRAKVLASGLATAEELPGV